jgi:hypothetical protein
VYKLGAMDASRLRARLALISLLVGIALIGLVPSAAAHPRVAAIVDAPPVGVAAVASPSTPSAWQSPAAIWLIPILAMALGLALTGRRRALAIALVLVLGVLAFETSVHSVHHLADGQTAARCAIASTSAHVPGAAQPGTPDSMQGPTRIGAAPVLDVDRPGGRVVRPDEGRAPPAA